MSSVKISLIFSFTSFIVCVSTQFVQYPYNNVYSGYPTYRQPCQSSCGSIQQTSRCQYLPCYSSSQYASQYPYSYPYPYYNTNYYNNYNNYNRRVVNPYGYLDPNSRTSDPYANVPVEIIDVGPTGTQNVRNLPSVPRTSDPYANVPVEIIDDDGSSDFWKNIPKLPKVTQTSNSNYSASQGSYTSDTVTQGKPVRAVITRTFQPLKQNPIINLDFVNGVAVTQKAEDEETTTEAIITTTEENEDVPEVSSWL